MDRYLQLYLDWFERVKPKIDRSGFQSQFCVNDQQVDNPSCTVYGEADDLSFMLIYWRSGDYSVDAIDGHGNTIELNIKCNLRGLDAIDHCLRDLLAKKNANSH